MHMHAHIFKNMQVNSNTQLQKDNQMYTHLGVLEDVFSGKFWFVFLFRYDCFNYITYGEIM